MEPSKEEMELRATQRRQRATIEEAAGIRTVVTLKPGLLDPDATEIQLRLVAAELVRKHELGPELEVLEIAQARRAARTFLVAGFDERPEWFKSAANRLREALAQDNEAGVIGPEVERQNRFREVLALLQAADVLADRSASRTPSTPGEAST